MKYNATRASERSEVLEEFIARFYDFFNEIFSPPSFRVMLASTRMSSHESSFIYFNQSFVANICSV